MLKFGVGRPNSQGLQMISEGIREALQECVAFSCARQTRAANHATLGISAHSVNEQERPLICGVIGCQRFIIYRVGATRKEN